MTKLIYEIVQHDGGWAYRANGGFSEAFATYEAARAAAESAAEKQAVAGETTTISFEDRDGHWHNEIAKGTDRPETEVLG